MSEELESVEEQSPKPQKKKGKKGLIITIAVLVPLLAIGGTLGAAYAGLLKIPGLKLPGMKTQSVAKNYTESEDEPTKLAKETKPTPPKIKIEAEPEPPAIKEPETDPELGAKKLAGIWNNMDAEDIVRISAAYRDEELARVLIKMEAEKVAEILPIIKDPKRAAKLSQLIESQASIIPEESS
ncbi:hypothetical protein CCB80_03500 [Armatimonadetes bacterium Uphvl-Ar1]|nr:hypothetical protein CCB80_03500 [Armatimonadetes bacterium Uphvl-Ar1]